MKLAFVVQRYGKDILGGAEAHCRMIAELLSESHQVEILTTCAKDYITWKNEYPEETEYINGIEIKRFRVKKPRNLKIFGKKSETVFKKKHKVKDELDWMDSQGPYSPELLGYIKENKDLYDFFIFFSYRYFQSFYGIQLVPEKSILVPTAEHDEALYLRIFKDFFKLPRAIMYNTHEEKELINHVSKNIFIPSDIVGVWVELPKNINLNKIVEIPDYKNYIIYLGRLDPNKGCKELFDYFIKFKEHKPGNLKLLLGGKPKMPIPDHEDIINLGFVSESEKFNYIKNSKLLVMPSPYESLSMVILEAWLMERPVLVNGQCEVLRGQVLRSNGGLYYYNYEEFEASLKCFIIDNELNVSMGKNGNKYTIENYKRDVIEKKYLDILERLKEV